MATETRSRWFVVTPEFVVEKDERGREVARWSSDGALFDELVLVGFPMSWSYQAEARWGHPVCLDLIVDEHEEPAEVTACVLDPEAATSLAAYRLPDSAGSQFTRWLRTHS